ncbi:hypothetical protein BJX68DRAFT_251279 [Aspergillus pseudodeflectus]|uniref:Uncharacterized protein n=1 Tax=Aspergillus pseudodeflectus TaxID=176178 RepID=A0ABR4J9R8_9EURO
MQAESRCSLLCLLTYLLLVVYSIYLLIVVLLETLTDLWSVEQLGLSSIYLGTCHCSTAVQCCLASISESEWTRCSMTSSRNLGAASVRLAAC